MVNPILPWSAKVCRWDDRLWTKDFVPNGANCDWLHSWMPNNCVCAERFGLICYRCSMFNVILHCGNNLHQIFAGHWQSHLWRLLMKWFLKVWMARSAGFDRWLCGLASWMSIFLSVMHLIIACDASLSSRWRMGLIPAVVSWSHSSLYASIKCGTVWDFMPVTRIPFVS